MIVSIMEMGAGSSGDSTRPILPTAVSTSGIAAMAMSWCCNTSCASPIDAWGIVVGMKRYEPSSSDGMNSRPSPGSACATTDTGRQVRIVVGNHPKRPSNPSQTVPPKSTTTVGMDMKTSLFRSAHSRARP